MKKVARIAVALAAAGFAMVAYVYLTLPDVRALASTNPTSTAFMRLRADEAAREGRRLRHVHRWVPYSRISQHLKRAVLVTEDSRFWDHDGIDLEEIKKSIEINLERGAAVRGGSTITQQLAKNLYLTPSKNPLRKLRELIIARRMEAALPKSRIFEIYLNVIEWGDGVWGAEAAARTHFGVGASALGREQAALLAGAIINPRLLNPSNPTPRLRRRQQLILGRMGTVEPPVPAPVPVTPPEPLDPSLDLGVPTDEVAPPPAELPQDEETPADAPPAANETVE